MCRVYHLLLLWLIGLLLNSCGDSTEPDTGTIEATSVTTGEPTDPGGYALMVDGDQGPQFGTNAILTISGLTLGDHELQLLDVAPHCAVTGANPRTVTVDAGAMARTTFEVQCSSPTGGIQVTATTIGESLDPDGYLVALDGGGGQPGNDQWVDQLHLGYRGRALSAVDRGGDELRGRGSEPSLRIRGA